MTATGDDIDANQYRLYTRLVLTAELSQPGTSFTQQASPRQSAGFA